MSAALGQHTWPSGEEKWLDPRTELLLRYAAAVAAAGNARLSSLPRRVKVISDFLPRIRLREINSDARAHKPVCARALVRNRKSIALIENYNINNAYALCAASSVRSTYILRVSIWLAPHENLSAAFHAGMENYISNDTLHNRQFAIIPISGHENERYARRR